MNNIALTKRLGLFDALPDLDEFSLDNDNACYQRKDLSNSEEETPSPIDAKLIDTKPVKALEVNPPVLISLDNLPKMRIKDLK